MGRGLRRDRNGDRAQRIFACPLGRGGATLAVHAYEQLRRAIVNGDLEPGTRLVNRSVARMIGISMTPIREAVNRLASDGLVDHVPGAGAFVRSVPQDEFIQLYDVREVLEPLAAGQAATLITPAEVAELQALAAASWQVIREAAATGAFDKARWGVLEFRFHTVVVGASRNEWLAKVLGDLKLLSGTFVRQRSLGKFLTVSRATRAWRDHRRLIRALRRRDADRATALMRQHVRDGLDAIVKFLAASTRDDEVRLQSRTPTPMRRRRVKASRPVTTSRSRQAARPRRNRS